MNQFQVPSLKFRVLIGLALLLGLTVAQPVRAQEAVPRSEAAELIFDQALAAFEDSAYAAAYERFRLVYSDFPTHRKTTAALLMAGKALYRQGRYAQAAEVLMRLLEAYSTSSYLDEARRVRSFARRRMGAGDAPKHIDLGIMLPMREGDLVLTQALFNGIRLAVKEFNESGQGIARMVFHDSGGDPVAARKTVYTLAGEGVDLVIGPLYSPAARAAAVAAEEERLVLVAPLATDADVSEGRRYAFQANPPEAMRGRQMAEFAVRGLRMEHFGIVAQQGNSLSEHMAEGFREEARRQGADVMFYRQLLDARAWTDLAARLGADTLASVEAVYLPLSGSEAPELIRSVLQSFEQAGVRVRILGNAEWHNRAIEQSASRFRVTYTNDFYVDESDPAVQAFIRRYREAYGEAPDELSYTARRLAYTGYDVTRFLLTHASKASERPLAEVLREAPFYQGLGLRINFEGSNANHALYYHRYRNGRIELLE